MMGLSVFDLSPYTIRLWSNYLAAALLLWSPMLFTKKKRWTYVIMLLLNLWFIGNLVYFRSYGDVLNRWCLQSMGNMTGIWSSVLPFLHIEDLIFPCFTLLWIILAEVLHPICTISLSKRVGFAVIAFLLSCTPQTLILRKAELPFSPFSSYYEDVSMGRIWYMHTFGAITHFANESFNYMFRAETPAAPVAHEEIKPFLQDTLSLNVEDNSNLLFVFFESWEYWTVGLCVGGEEVTPNINRLIALPQSACYPLQSQVRGGKSSDAQLIAFTGLLPIRNGAVSMRYAENTFPSWVKAANASAKQLFTPCEATLWNQIMLARALGFDSLYAETVSDKRLVKEVNRSISSAQGNWIIAMTTMASHSPFIEYADSLALPNENSYSIDEQRYLQCVHYTDHALGLLIDRILSDSSLASKTRIVITGDHPIFQLDRPVPFVLYDPFWAPEEAGHALRQVDIYTTLVKRMNGPTGWRGLGRYLTDTTSVCEEELFVLSDRLIRTNYFHQP